MARQFADATHPTPRQVGEFVQWADGRLWLYDQTSTVDAERVYAVIRYAVDQLHVQHFVVDNLTKCVAADDDYAGQKQVVDKLTPQGQLPQGGDLGSLLGSLMGGAGGAGGAQPDLGNLAGMLGGLLNKR